MKNISLPEKIKVKIIAGKSGVYIAELPDYDIHTEADSRRGLDFMINDLIYAYFCVPKKNWGKIWYKEETTKPESENNLRKLLLYQQYIASNSKCLSK